MQRTYLVFGILVLLMTAYGSFRGLSYWSLMSTGRWSPSGPRAYHK